MILSYVHSSDDVIISIIILIVVAVALLSAIPASIAKGKGYGFAGFFILGIFFFPIALIVSLCLSNKNRQMNELKTTLYNANVVQNQNKPPTQTEQIGRYYSLLQQGAITQEEFNEMKKKILES